MPEDTTTETSPDKKDCGINNLNQKRTYDLHQTADLKTLLQSQDHHGQLQNVALQALQNAVSLANKVSTDAAVNAQNVNAQSLRHESLASDRQWNVDEQSMIVKKILGSQEAQDVIASAIAGLVAGTTEE